MTVAQALAYICMTSGRIFTCQFLKRSTRELREITCRLGVKKGLKNGPMTYNPAEKGLLWVYEMTTQARKSIPLEGLLRIKIDGEWVEIEQ